MRLLSPQRIRFNFVMKTLTTFTALVIFFCFSASSQDKTSVFKGKVHFEDKALKGATIEVYEAGDLILESSTNSAGIFKVELKSEREFMVDITMENLRIKTIWINTEQTQKLTFKVPTFTFDVHLKVEEITPYDEMSEIPVTLIKYQPKKEVYYMDKTYKAVLKNKKRRIKESMLQIR